MRTIIYSLLAATLAVSFSACQQDTSAGSTILLSAPAGNRYCEIDPTGETIIPNGRVIAPMGKTIRVAPHPFGLALSSDGQVAVTANSGVRPFSISILDQLDQENPRVRQIPEGYENDEGVLESVFMGLAITPNNRYVYVGGGSSNKIFQFDLQNGSKIDSINCAVIDKGGLDYTDGYIGDLALSKDGSRLFAVDQIGFRLLIIDTGTKEILHNIPTGRYPFGLTLSPDNQAVYVANVGMFEYSFIDGLTEENSAAKALDYPTSAFGSEEMVSGVKTDSISFSGLGDANAPESFSVWKIELGGEPVITKKIKTGVLVGQPVDGIPAVGGSSPNSLVANDRYVFVSNGNNDNISVIDFATDTVAHTIQLRMPKPLDRTRGIIPFGLALSPDGSKLFVAESGINAAAVINTANFEVLGHIPTGWFPSKLAVT
ncbi:MAG: YncE family protein, partial [Bacteroidota bacterium]